MRKNSFLRRHIITPCECITSQFPDQSRVLSPSTLAFPCLLHDIGTAPSNLRSSFLSFEFPGSILALNLLQNSESTNGAAACPRPQAESVAEAILRHQDIGARGAVTFLTQLLPLATIYDNVSTRPGAEAPVPVHKVTRRSVDAVWPRTAWAGCFAATVREEVRRKPWATTTRLGAKEFALAMEAHGRKVNS
ncbi:hypothetical protein VTK73DRAFT_1380 [Phialemonium thermophilum]|uniref:HD domain-containing protein n=1 Tax=Phialemonium thermophilum TaxID=223376 RepID=A0ABR3XAW6_9PEZI